VSQKECIVKAVTFDLWETLLFEKDGDSNQINAARCRHLAEVLNKPPELQVANDQVEAACKQVVSRLLEVWSRNEDISHVEQLELLVKFVSNGSLALKPEWIEELSSAYVSPFFEVPPHLNPDAKEVLEELADAEKRIGLICNTGLTPGFAVRTFLESEGALEYFDFLTFSDEIGYRKPESRVFHLTARKLRVDPRSIVHVGDNLKVDVWGAKNAGFKAIYFECDEGRDRIAAADPNSLVSLSRNLGDLSAEETLPDRTINSLSRTIQAIKELER